ncbi:MAG: hypothetical protein HQL91_08570 [Magnetococcales bacterium]|nr:hypothetical protein [Magnetococcales bacterium]
MTLLHPCLRPPRLALALLSLLLLCWSPPHADAAKTTNATLSEKFTLYDETMHQFIVAMIRNKWTLAEELAKALTDQGEVFQSLGHEENNATWEYYASNLTHHGQELQEACRERNGIEAVHLIATLGNHLGEIQSAIPVWLLEHLGQQITILEQGIENHDPKRTRDAAEILHNAAHKIILSASTSRQSYRHTRWLTNLLDINRLGDEMVGEVHNEDWDGRRQNLQRIKALYASWKDGFHPALITVLP